MADYSDDLVVHCSRLVIRESEPKLSVFDSALHMPIIFNNGKRSVLFPDIHPDTEFLMYSGAIDMLHYENGGIVLPETIANELSRWLQLRVIPLNNVWVFGEGLSVPAIRRGVARRESRFEDSGGAIVDWAYKRREMCFKKLCFVSIEDVSLSPSSSEGFLFNFNDPENMIVGDAGRLDAVKLQKTGIGLAQGLWVKHSVWELLEPIVPEKFFAIHWLSVPSLR